MSGPLSNEIARARHDVLHVCPYLAHIVYALDIHPTDADIKVSGKGLVLSAECLKGSREHMAGLIYHAAVHVLLEHAQRGRGLRQDIWALATDLAISYDSPFNLENAIYPALFGYKAGLSAEIYYAALLEDNVVPPDKGCGISCLAGEKSFEFQTAQKKTAAAILGNAPGGAPGELARWAAISLSSTPERDWRATLSRVLGSSIGRRRGSSDYAYTCPSRRQASLGYGVGKPILPALVRPKQCIAIVIDTSSSMRQDELEEAVRHAQSIAALPEMITFLITCDYIVRSVKKTSTVKGPFTGGGGTRFAPAFEALESISPRPNFCVYITDGRGEAPKLPPKNIKTVWLLIGDEAQEPDFQSSERWGESIYTCNQIKSAQY